MRCSNLLLLPLNNMIIALKVFPFCGLQFNGTADYRFTAVRLPKINAGASIPVYFGIFCWRIYRECELIRGACTTGGTNWRGARWPGYGSFTAIILGGCYGLISDNPLGVHLYVPCQVVLRTGCEWMLHFDIFVTMGLDCGDQTRDETDECGATVSSGGRVRGARAHLSSQHPAPRLVTRPPPPPLMHPPFTIYCLPTL